MFDPDEFWTFAENLLNSSSPDECACRVAAGRAYYAIFLTLKKSMRDNHGETFGNRASDHGLVVRTLRERNRHPLANAVNSLYKLRETADYDLDAIVDHSTVTFEIEKFRLQYENAKVY